MKSEKRVTGDRSQAYRQGQLSLVSSAVQEMSRTKDHQRVRRIFAKTSFIRRAVSMHYRLVTDTDTSVTSTGLAYRRAGSNIVTTLTIVKSRSVILNSRYCRQVSIVTYVTTVYKILMHQFLDNDLLPCRKVRVCKCRAVLFTDH